MVNDDQLSLAIGKRGQNVRLAARLTGWDVDILTPPEFQAGVARLDQTLKAIEGITQEMVDKVIALGLIDVRDIEEVGAGPLMEELALDEAKATFVVNRCGEEAKIVAVEQEAKKIADASAKAADRAALMAAAKANPTASADARAFANALQGGGESPETSETLPGPLEATEGAAPEIVTHQEQGSDGEDELSPEEQAVHSIAVPESDDSAGDQPDELSETAALAEGSMPPPAGIDSDKN